MRTTLIALGVTALLAVTAAPALAGTGTPSAMSGEHTVSAAADRSVHEISSGVLRVGQSTHQVFDGTLSTGTVEVSLAEARYYSIQVDAVDIAGNPVQATITYDHKSAIGTKTGSCTVLKHGKTASFVGNCHYVPDRLVCVMNRDGDGLSLVLRR